ncbi:MAG: 4-hydroxy-3-methylbut-2-en-1-yl diphosphate synthase [Bacteroidetes bacterium]|nr:MAG: 4-hydroxy-3-methylbut-2-en-1-yl diphosphate synthase [Bacteroidota bacterium]
MKTTYRSQEISIAGLRLGGERLPRIQSMCNTNTNDIDASLAQCERMIAAGAELVRLTTQGKREVRSLAIIAEKLHTSGKTVPLVADIHFRPALALEAAKVCEKIRINPGNYLRNGSLDELLPELLEVCEKHGTAIRIGVNHGSLSPDILEEFGDTVEGMVESAMRFLRLCHHRSFRRVVVSMKSSNPRVMIQAVRLLTLSMQKEGMAFPLHLGVTEAGDGPEGRIKSATGMAPLLLEGMGDTIRVSLTEAPEVELPVAETIVNAFPKPPELPYDPFADLPWDPFHYKRRVAKRVGKMGAGQAVRIVSENRPDPAIDLLPGKLASDEVFLLETGPGRASESKETLINFCSRNQELPIVLKYTSTEKDPDLFRIQLAGTLGSLLVDGQIDAVWAENPHFDSNTINDLLLIVLQAAGARISRTEYIACPSCGRTHFDIQKRLQEIKAATSHLRTLKIGVMGCIVNGPGEMADADYGYVGAGPGRVSLYKARTPVFLNLPEEEALAKLLELIKQEGDWQDQ